MKNVDNYSFMDINRVMRGFKVYANVNGIKGEIEKFRNHFESLLSRFTLLLQDSPETDCMASSEILI